MTDKNELQTLINPFSGGDLKTNALNFFHGLGYSSLRTQNLTVTELFGYQNERITQSAFLFQLAGDNLNNVQSIPEPIDNTIIESYLFVVIELTPAHYSRSDLVKITRELNKQPQPVLILFKHGETLTLSVIHRRLHKRDDSKDVLEKVTLLKDIRIANPHRAHLDILESLVFENLKPQPKNFVELHNAWQAVLNTKELNKQFYEKLFDWYLFALPQVKFPQIRNEIDCVPNEQHQSESLIRLLTRLLFVWFMKEKGLINTKLFETENLKTILKNFTGENSNDTIFYKAILQNLFFATLNMPIEKRKAIFDGFAPSDYGNQLVYRYADLFEAENFGQHFENIPFLNGGLFDCLDQRKTDDSPEIRLDGFSTQTKKQAIVPDKLFFSEYKNVDLSGAYDNKKKSNVTVYGLLTIFEQHKFTVEENTPIEEDIALDPELLGKVFENLLAAYNPETGTTARKQTGSFYTPREIVDYMVDESLTTYLKSKLENMNAMNLLGDHDLVSRSQQNDLLTRLNILFSYEEVTPKFSDAEKLALIKAIDNLKILDPACGSGAFPMGVLHKLVFILSKLDPKNEKWRDRQLAKLKYIDDSALREKAEKVINDAFENNELDYGRKLFLIENCIHGVDIQPIAVQISKLRFFISLIVDQKSHPEKPNFGIRALPNLDFKIIAANTLIAAPKEDEAMGVKVDDAFFSKFSELTHDYFNVATPDEKKKLREKIEKLIIAKCHEKIRGIDSIKHSGKNQKIIEQLESDIKRWQSYANLFKHEAVEFFEPRYFFPQLTNGFDIVIGNPPYVSAVEMTRSDAQKVYFKAQYPEATGAYDIYVLFLLKTLEIISKTGIYTWIIPNKFLIADYAKGTANKLLQNGLLFSIDVSTFNVFKNASVYPIIIHGHKGHDTQFQEFLLEIYSDLENRNFKKVEKLKRHKSFADFGILFSSGATGFEAQKLKEIVTESGDKNTIPFVVSGSIDRYSYNNVNVRFMGLKLKTSFIAYSDKVASSKWDFWKKEKIIIAGMTKVIEAVYEKNSLALGVGVYAIHGYGGFNPYFLTAILNSKFLSYYINVEFKDKHLAGGYLAINKSTLEKLPLIKPEIEIENLIADNSLKIHEVKSKNPVADTSALEREIDVLVYGLYGLSEEDILIVEGGK